MSDATTLFYAYVLTGGTAALFLSVVIGVLVAAQRKQVEQSRRFSQGLVEAQEAERSRIARDLHDDVIQRVALIGGELSALGRLIPDKSPAVAQRIDGLREELHDLAEEVRGMARRAHPAILDHLGLLKAVQNLGADMQVSDELAVEVIAPPDADFEGLSAPAGLALYRVAQEGLRNVVRHSGVREARVTLGMTDREVTLSVEDHGKGLPAEKGQGMGLGLLGLNERLRAVQGSLTVESPGKGTKVTARVPRSGGKQ
ncbi:MAG: sensor histidine kinase [Gemmatimonadales bacterium]